MKTYLYPIFIFKVEIGRRGKFLQRQPVVTSMSRIKNNLKQSPSMWLFGVFLESWWMIERMENIIALASQETDVFHEEPLVCLSFNI